MPNYLIEVVNPAIAKPPLSVVYTGQANDLTVTVVNASGSDQTIGGSSTGTYLYLGVPAGLMDAAGAGAVKAQAPWTVAKFDAPGGGSPIGAGNYVFYLTPPSGGVALPNGGQTAITLTGLTPSATGVGPFAASYDFDGIPADALSATTPLSALAPPNKDLPSLFGPNALSFEYYVNAVGPNNPISVSIAGKPVIDNAIHFQFIYQAGANVAFAAKTAGSSGLVPSWDPIHPPTFRVWFPYDSATGSLPAYECLTDCLEPGDPNYDPATSAWKIPLAFSPTRPNETNNGFWEISLDPTSLAHPASGPVWMVRPVAANVNLFTATQTSSSLPGPVLDAFAADVVSRLPVHAEHPETLIYLQWNDFPGYKDGLAVYPVQKSVELQILSFSVEVVRSASGPVLQASWNTTGSSCFFSATSVPQEATATNAPFPLSAQAPLQSSYTLTAIGNDGITKMSKTVSIHWAMSQSLPVDVSMRLTLQTSPDGRQVLVWGGTTTSTGFGIATYDAETLAATGLPELTAGSGLTDFAFSPDGKTIYANGADDSGNNLLYGFDAITRAPVAGSPATVGSKCWIFPQVAVSPDGSRVFTATSVFNIPAIQVGGTTIPPSTTGANQVVVTNADGFGPVSGSPFPLNAQTWAMAVNPVSGWLYLSQETGIVVLDGANGQKIEGSPIGLTGPFMLAVSPDGKFLYTVGFNLVLKSFYLAQIDAATLEVKSQMLNGYGYVAALEAFFGYPLASLAVSADGKLLFFIGVSLDSQSMKDPSTLTTRFSVYDTETMQEMPWSPVEYGSLLPIDLAVSPDGTRLFVLGAVYPFAQDSTSSLFAVDPIFS